MELIFDKIEERDVDFVVMRAFAEIEDFISLFLSKIGIASAEVIKVEHSFTDSELGESDITVIIMVNNKKIGLLIENKIDAKAMHNQCGRYYLRGERGKEAGEYDDYAVFLIAPELYIKTNEEAQKYVNKVTYEEIYDFFVVAGRIFDSEIIKSATKKQEQGYIVQEVPAITEFWKKLYIYCCESNKEIEMYKAEGPKGPRSTWPQFKVPLKGTALYYKAEPGVVDLQFSGKSEDGNRLRSDLLEIKQEDMHWIETGSSLSLRIKVKPMNFRKEFGQYAEELKLMIDAVERMTTLATKLNDRGYVV